MQQEELQARPAPLLLLPPLLLWLLLPLSLSLPMPLPLLLKGPCCLCMKVAVKMLHNVTTREGSLDPALGADVRNFEQVGFISVWGACISVWVDFGWLSAVRRTIWQHAQL